MKRRSPSTVPSFFAMNDYYIINPASIDSLSDWICTKRPCSSYITLFFKKYICSSLFSTG